ncbi:hypothetical protein HWV62_10861 [Athelia sp. TMB]|nr:hypothetical protein HWV62_10861 [Athelia sp. TMB]
MSYNSTRDATLNPSINTTTLDPESFLDMDESGSEYHSRMQGLLAVVGVVLSIVFSIICIIVGVFVSRHTGLVNDVVLPPGPWRNSTFPAVNTPYKGLIAFLPGVTVPTEILSLLLNFVVTLFTECIGFVHSVTLKSALASQGQLDFNTNPRLFSLMRFKNWYHPNGPICNTAMMILLTLSYSSSSLCIVPIQSLDSNDGLASDYWSALLFGVPAILLGVTILFQACIAIYSISTVKVLTWSSSPFDTAYAMLRNGLITRRPGRSMHTAVDDDAPLAPSREYQPSAWQCHPVIKRVVVLLWLLSIACAGWGGLIYYVWMNSPMEPFVSKGSWALVPNPHTFSLSLSQKVDPVRGITAWPVIFAFFAAAQGSITIGLHCAELNANVMRDELQWRQATTSSGMPMSRNPILGVLGSLPNLSLLIAKPVIHWLFGLAMNMRATADPLIDVMLNIEIVNRPAQLFYLSGALLIFAIGMTAMVLRHPSGVQPAAFGHIQTLADMIDVWAPRIWWGYKVTNVYNGHAGTSDWPDLPPMTLGPSETRPACFVTFVPAWALRREQWA